MRSIMRERRSGSLGFAADGKIVVAGPIGRNFGFWTDSSMIFVPDEYKVISEKAFESAWAVFQG